MLDARDTNLDRPALRPDRIVLALVVLFGVSAGVYGYHALHGWLGSNEMWVRWLGICILLGGLLLPIVPLVLRSSWWAVGFALVVYAEFGAALLAYYTVGEIYSAMMMLGIWINVFAMWLLLFRRRVYRVIACVLYLTIGALAIGQQGVYGVRWYRNHAEAESIIAYAAAHHAEHGDYPPDLDGYKFERSETRAFFTYRLTSATDYWLSYWISSTATSHSYSPTDEDGWFYYPD